MGHYEESIFIRGMIVALCEAILNDELGVIAGSRRLARLGDELRDNSKDFYTFKGIDSSSDHLPVDFERKNWSTISLAGKDKEIVLFELENRDKAFAACRALISRFHLKDGV